VIDYVVNCGCSFLKGTDKPFISHKINSEAIDINLSSDGASNDRIIRKTTEWVVENESKLKDTFFVIGITEPSRYELWDNVKDRYNQGSVSDISMNYDTIEGVDSYGEKGYDGQSEDAYQLTVETQKMYYKYHSDEQVDIDRSLRNIFLLMSLFERYNCKYLIFDSIVNIRKLVKEDNRYFKKVFNNKNYYSGESWAECCSLLDETGGGEHPSYDDIRLWSDKMYNYTEEISLWKE